MTSFAVLTATAIAIATATSAWAMPDTFSAVPSAQCAPELASAVAATAVQSPATPKPHAPPITVAEINTIANTVKLSDGSEFRLNLKEVNSQNMSAAEHVDIGHYKMSDTPPVGTVPHLSSGLHTYHALMGFLAKRPDLKSQMVVHIQKSSGILKIHLPHTAFSGSEWKQPWREQSHLMVKDNQGNDVELRPVIIFPQDWTLDTVQEAVNTSLTSPDVKLHAGPHFDMVVYTKYRNVSVRIESWFDAQKLAWILTSAYPQESKDEWTDVNLTF